MAGVAGEMIELSLDDVQRRKAARVRCAAEIANLLTLADDGALKAPQAKEARPADDDAGEAGLRSAVRSSPRRTVPWATGWRIRPSSAPARRCCCGTAASAISTHRSSPRVISTPSSARTQRRPHPPRQIAVLDRPPLDDTAGVRFETTLRHIYPDDSTATAKRSELSHAACHSRLELDTARILDRHPAVAAWVRNFGLDWSLPYHFDGA